MSNAAATITLDADKLAQDPDYRTSVLGIAAAYTTASGNRVVGTITERPIGAGGLALAVTQPNGKWAAIYAGDTLELV